MNFQQDWLLRQIENMVQVITTVILQKDAIHYQLENEANLTQTDMLHRDISRLVARHEICKAEDLLHEKIDVTNKESLAVALDFYQTLNLLRDEELERYHFSREEIHEGLTAILNHFGVGNFLL